MSITRTFHLYHGNVRKEDPERNREEKKIQLGTENDPRTHMDDALILGFYVYENKDSLSDTIIVAWPIEEEKNYPANPSLRVNMRTDIQVAKNTGYYVDKVTGKNLVVFRPEFIYHYIENYKNLQYSNVLTVHQGESVALRKKESKGILTDDEKTQIAIIRDAIRQNRKFPEKVIKYLWDDAFKFNREVIFEVTEYQSLEQVIRAFMYAQGLDRFKVFKDNVKDAFTGEDEE